ncbi:MAG: polyphosphate kinase, partial [Cyanobacteria bacterium J06607_13]
MSKAPAKQPSSADNLGKAASKSKTDPTEPPPSKSSGSTSEKVSKQAAQTSKPNQPAAPAVDAPYNGNLSDGQWYLSRELSWLEFNRRVLHEATDERTPLLERLKFLSIFSSNLDEYFMVRVAATKQQIEANVSKRTPDGRTPSEQLEAISQHLRPMFTQVHSYFQTQLKPNLLEHGIYLLNYEDLAPTQTDYLDQYFNEQIFPVLTPLAVDPGHPFPYISNLSLNLAVEVQEQNSEDSHFARVKVPKVLPRFVELPDALQKDNQAHGPESSKAVSPCQWMGVPMEQVIAHNIEALFPGMSVKNCSVFRITRNADLSVEEDEADDLMLAIEQELRKRRLGGSVVRMESEAGMNEDMRRTLMNELNLLERDVYDVEGFIGLTDMMSFMSLPLNTLKDSSWKPVTPAPWKAVRQGDSEDVFSLIRRRDRLVHHPYQAFSGTVQTFITQAAIDPDVLAIKMTLYRTSGDS